MNNGFLLIGLLLAGLFLFRQTPGLKTAQPLLRQPGLIGVNTSQPGFGGFDSDDPW